MKWFTYLHRTPLKQIRSDWREYIDLHKKCWILNKLRAGAHAQLIEVVDGGKAVKPAPACIYTKYYVVTLPNTLNGNGHDAQTVISKEKCRKFRENKKCQKLDCPCIGRNHEYGDICEQYNVMRQARRDFWRVKFAQALQRTK